MKNKVFLILLGLKSIGIYSLMIEVTNQKFINLINQKF